MRTTIQLSQPSKSISVSEKISLAQNKLENWRVLIMSASLLFQGCILAPALVLISSFYDIGLTDLSLITALIGMVATLVSNLSLVNVKVILGISVINTILTILFIAMHFVF